MRSSNSTKRMLVVAGFGESLIAFRGRLLAELSARGLDVHVAAPGLTQDADLVARLTDLGCTVHDAAINRTGRNPLQDLKTLIRLVRLYRSVRPTHTLCYTIKPVVYGMLAAWICGVQHRTALITGLGYSFNSSSGLMTKVAQLAARLLYRFGLRGAHTVIFQNPDDRDLFVRTGLAAARKCRVVSGSGVSLEHYAARPFVDDGYVDFLLIGRLIRDKGVFEYADAAQRMVKKFPNARFHLIGWLDSNPGSATQQDLQRWIEAGLIYHGKVDDVRDLLHMCDVYVLPSYREGTPRSVLEAMAVGRPIVTTDAPGCRETVQDGINGYLVPVQSVDALVDAFTAFMHDADLIRAMGGASRRLVEQKYDVNVVNKHMMEYLAISPLENCETNI